jgi:hypothetical protein
MKGLFAKRAWFVFLLALGTPCVAYAGPGRENIDPATLLGKIVYTEGEVTLNGAAPEIGDAVRPGDRIHTGASGLAELTFGPKNILQFRENTDAVIEPAWSGVQLESGKIAAVLKGLARLGYGADGAFQVRTAMAVMGVRGTVFFVNHPGDEEVYFCTCYGKLHLEASDGTTAEDTEAYHHAAVWYVRTAAGIRSYPSGLHYHDDAMLNALARKINTTVRWRD